MKTIFVQIASYRDSELPATLRSCLSMASHAERLRFGLCWQYDENTSDDLVEFENDERFRIDRIHYSKSKGCCWARNRTNQLYGGEDYTLQIDAHMRFCEGWDDSMINMLEGIEHEKPLLTTYPPPYYLKDGEAELQRHHGIQTLRLKALRTDLTTVLAGELAGQTDKPGKSKFLAAGYIFTLGRFCREVEYDPEIYFQGEEISLAARAYTHGYNFYYPHQDLLWHLYQHGSPLHWTDHDSVYQDLEKKAIQRLEILLLGDHAQLGKHGLGNVRKLEQFEEYAGIRFRDVIEHREKPIDPLDNSKPDKIVSTHVNQPTIFVALAAYSEPELAQTIEHCINMAAQPGRLRFGVCLQYDNNGVDEMHEDCIDDLAKKYPIRLVKYPYQASQGGCWARSIVQSLYRHEDYTLQVDAHSRFVARWDEVLINMMNTLPSAKPLITGFPPLYFIEQGVERFTSLDDLSRVPVTRITEWSEEGWIAHPTEYTAEISTVPRRTRVLSGAFVFTIGRWNIEINQDPYHLYTGEEFALTLRAYTSGYDLFNPTQIVVWHRGHPTPNPKFINDFDTEVVSQRHTEAVSRLQILLAGDPEQQLAPFSLGRERTLDDYRIFSGLDCENYTIHDDARRGIPPDPVTMMDEYVPPVIASGGAGSGFLDLTIHLAGMSPLELQCESTSPIPDALLGALQSNAHRQPGDEDPVMFLQFDDHDDHEIYFLQSRLEALEVHVGTENPLI